MTTEYDEYTGAPVNSTGMSKMETTVKVMRWTLGLGAVAFIIWGSNVDPEFGRSINLVLIGAIGGFLAGGVFMTLKKDREIEALIKAHKKYIDEYTDVKPVVVARLFKKEPTLF